MRDLSLHLMDIIQNSLVAGASYITIEYSENTRENNLKVVITDNGSGMTTEQLKSAVDPFYTTRTTRDIGLGIPLFKMSAEKTQGNFNIESKQGEGTKIDALFHTDHIDMVPLGDTASTIQLLVSGNPDVDFIFTMSKDDKKFTLSTLELREILGEVPFSDPSITQWIGNYLKEGIAEL